MNEAEIEQAFAEAFPPKFDKDAQKEVDHFDAPYQKRWTEIGFRAGLLYKKAEVKDDCDHDFEPRFRGDSCLDTCTKCGKDRIW